MKLPDSYLTIGDSKLDKHKLKQIIWHCEQVRPTHDAAYKDEILFLFYNRLVMTHMFPTSRANV